MRDASSGVTLEGREHSQPNSRIDRFTITLNQQGSLCP
jgi:hypothetical protein